MKHEHLKKWVIVFVSVSDTYHTLALAIH